MENEPKETESKEFPIDELDMGRDAMLRLQEALPQDIGILVSLDLRDERYCVIARLLRQDDIEVVKRVLAELGENVRFDTPVIIEFIVHEPKTPSMHDTMYFKK